jgi:hypothetical protein
MQPAGGSSFPGLGRPAAEKLLYAIRGRRWKLRFGLSWADLDSLMRNQFTDLTEFGVKRTAGCPRFASALWTLTWGPMAHTFRCPTQSRSLRLSGIERLPRFPLNAFRSVVTDGPSLRSSHFACALHLRRDWGSYRACVLRGAKARARQLSGMTAAIKKAPRQIFGYADLLQTPLIRKTRE